MTFKRLVALVLVLLAAMDAIGPQVTRHSPPTIAWLWVGGALLLAATLGLLLWHGRQMAELRAQWLVSEDWERVSSWRHTDRWVCPQCAAEVPTLAHAEQHSDPSRSACAAFKVNIENVSKVQETVGERRLIVPDWASLVHPNGAGIDTMNAENGDS